MKIGVLGTGMVGQTIGTKLVELGHEVLMGARTRDSEKGVLWEKKLNTERAQLRTFSEAAADTELIFNCTAGMVSLEALRLAGAVNLKGKILLDISNPLDFSEGFPPSLGVCNKDSVGEQIQAAFPETLVVKTLNTVSNTLMVSPQKLAGDHVVFVAGNDAAAKKFVSETILTAWFGWRKVMDLGDIAASRATEMYLPLWLRMWKALGTTEYNIALVSEPATQE